MFASSVSQPKRLGPVPDDVDEKRHHVKNLWGKTTKFHNPHDSYKFPNRWTFFSFLAASWFNGASEYPRPVGNEISRVAPTFHADRFAAAASSPDAPLRATWLGHACYYVEFPSGLRVLFDPVFEDCCAPVNFARFKRYTPPACAIKDLPHVDAVLISHSHYDHLSHPSVLEIQKHHPGAHFFVPLGLRTWFEKSGVSAVTELDWWEDAELSLVPGGGSGGATHEYPRKSSASSQPSRQSDILMTTTTEKTTEHRITARISCLPCQHASGRGLFDQDRTLWCSWGVSSGTGSDTDSSPAADNTKSVWFGGDTGYRTVPPAAAGAADDYAAPFDTLPKNPQFAQIGRLRGPFDLGLIPIGAYAPRAIMSAMHGNPFDAVEMMRDTRCARAMGIHWGTWVLTTEDVLEPPRLLREALRRKGLSEEGVFDVCRCGESREF